METWSAISYRRRYRQLSHVDHYLRRPNSIPMNLKTYAIISSVVRQIAKSIRESALILFPITVQNFVPQQFNAVVPVDFPFA